MKKLKKTALAVFTMCVFVMCTMFFAANVSAAEVVDSGECGDRLTWVLYTDGELIIHGKGEIWNYSVAQLAPWYDYCESITSVSIGNGVTAIGDFSFYDCGNIISIIIPDGVISIGNLAFYNCENLASFIIPDSVVSIGESAFMYCRDLKAVIISKSLAAIEDNTFDYCTGLTNITIPDSITTIGDYAFNHCESLANITIPDSITTIGDYAFNYCTNLTSVTVLSCNAEFWNKAIANTRSDLVLYGYPDSTTEVYAVENGYSFAALEVIEPERPVTASGECGDSLAWVLYTDGELVIEGTGAMWDYTSKRDAPWYAYNKNSIKTVTIKEGVTSIGNYAFYSFSNLTSVSIPEGVTSIGNTAFGFCLKLPEITLPNTLETIGTGAIRACRELTSVTIPASVSKISTYLFADCFKLESIIVDENNPNYLTEDGVLFTKDHAVLLQYPAGKRDADYSVPVNVKTIESGSYYGCQHVESIFISQNITMINPGAFSFCEALRLFTVDESNTRYSSDGDGILYDKDMTTLIRYPAGKTNTDYTVLDGVHTIFTSSFDGCVYLRNVTFPESVASIGGHAFMGSQSLESATVLCRTAKQGVDLFHHSAENFTLYGYSGSTTETYASENGHSFVAIAEPAPDRIIGDINGDGQIDIRDAIVLFQHSMLPDLFPVTYPFSLDIDKDGSLDIRDAAYLFRHSMLPDLFPLK